jgi:preprotein translocase subunit Sec61beta
MNKAEKILAQKVEAHFESPSATRTDFTRDETLILERWLTLKIVNEDAFLDATSAGDDHKKYLQGQRYPFTHFGEQEITKSGYMHFRESKGITILRDALTVIAFLVSLYLAIAKIFLK